MIPKIVAYQAIVLLASTIFAYIAFDGVAAISLLLAGLSLLIPNLFLAVNIALTKYSQLFFWLGVLLNKVFILVLFFISIKVLGEPNLGAFLVGVILITQVPLGYILFSFTKR